jgi:DNA helicase II / ATP-dependent DNA helicase PcrA
MLAKALESEDAELLIKAEKVLETARVYDFYQKYLEEEQLLDFGDLVFRAAALLQENQQVRQEVRSRYDAILVDEFQDVNRACGVLLKQIAGDGRGLWTVGDLRQCIYRWRGASPANIELFATDFPSAEIISLETNYRSRTEIVDLFAHFARQMSTAGDDVFSSWDAKRGPAKTEHRDAIKVEIANSLRGEAGRIAKNIEEYRSLGLELKDCAVICRTHAQLNKVGKVLGEQGIPVFYLGEIFERDEVRDLLSLLDLLASPGNHTLIRVAQFPEYSIPIPDALKIIAFQKEHNLRCREVLIDADFCSGLSEEGKPGIRKLFEHLSAHSPGTTAWRFLSRYLFDASAYLEPYCDAGDVQSQSRKLAIYQFLRLAQDSEKRFAAGSVEPVGEFLAYVKKLSLFQEDRSYAQMPAEAENLDAVRLLTVHSAKGLEFNAVFLPYLGAGKTPANRRSTTCPNPDGMITGDADFHDSEEECLFFVAMSRARDFLHLSRASEYGKSSSNESKFLTALSDLLPAADVSGPDDRENVPVALPARENPAVFLSMALDRYMKCARNYFYTDVLGLKSVSDKSTYQKFQACVYDILREIQKASQQGESPLSQELALARLDELWVAAALETHPYSPAYKEQAQNIVRTMCDEMETATAGGGAAGGFYEVPLPNGSVRVPVDSVEIMESINGGETVVSRRYEIGKPPKEIKPKDVEVLIAEALKSRFPGVAPSICRIYLGDGSVEEVSITPAVTAKRLKKYDEAIAAITRREFEPEPDGSRCPHCAHFFVCPSGDCGV